MGSNIKTSKALLTNHHIALILMSLFWIPFLYSAQTYHQLYWFNYLFLSRMALCVLPIIALAVSFSKKKEYKIFIPIYYSLAMLVQASHGLLEPANKIDFYSYTTLFLFMGTLGFRGNIRTWIKNYLPLALIAHIIPLFFKDPIFFSSFGAFVDNFTFNVAFTMFSIILLNIINGRYKILENNLQLKNQLIQEQDLRLEIMQEKQKALHELSRQVAHDIRSPLTALKFSLDDITKLPEDTRVRLQSAINRVEDIANNLLYSNKKPENGNSETTPSTVLLSTVIESIISEKRIEYRNLPKIKISSNFDTNSYGLFARFSPSTLKRIISNILTNSIEAMKNKSGEINVKLYHQNKNNIIEIQDNGTGIPQEIINNVYDEGFSTKSHGNGLGLYHAKSEIDKSGGNIEISESDDSGTTIKISLPSVPKPTWFARMINLTGIETIIIIDDDESIHHIWSERFRDHKVNLKHYFKSDDLLAKYKSVPESHLLLSDYELIGDSRNGLQLITELKANNNAILITSHFEDDDILSSCLKNQITLLPKPLAELSPIIKREQNQGDSIVLIDDDEIIHMAWKVYFNKLKKTLLSFYSIDDFLCDSKHIPKSTTICVDSNLGNGIKGEIESERIFNLGFENIILTTGHNDIKKDTFPWIKEITSKQPFN